MVAQATRIKSSLEKVYELCNLVEATGGIREKLDIEGEEVFVKALKTHLLYFLAYLSASDGVLSWKECRYISDLFDINITPNRLNEIIIEKDLYSTRFENDVPLLLQIFVAFDNAIYEMPQADFIDEELGSVLFNLYGILAGGLIEANGRSMDELDENEESDLQTYLGMMQKYIDDNTERHHTDLITGFTKNTGYDRDDEENDSGVKAPRKNQKNNGSVKAPSKKK